MSIVLKMMGRDDISFEVSETGSILGRSRGSNINLVHNSVSSSHCEFYFANGHLAVRDLESTNGTFINGNLIHSSRLYADDVLRIGSIEFQLDIDAMTELEQNRYCKQEVNKNEADFNGHNLRGAGEKLSNFSISFGYNQKLKNKVKRRDNALKKELKNRVVKSRDKAKENNKSFLFKLKELTGLY